MRCEWGISPTEESLITSIVFCGTMAGAYGWGVLGDARGRRIGFAATAAFTFAFGILSAAAPNYLVRFSALQNVQNLIFLVHDMLSLALPPLMHSFLPSAASSWPLPLCLWHLLLQNRRVIP